MAANTYPRFKAQRLKPSDLGVNGKNVSFDEYKKLLNAAIDKRRGNAIHGSLADYLTLLVEHAAALPGQHASIESDLRFLYVKNEYVHSHVSEVQKEFGETLGPLAIVNENFFGIRNNSQTRIITPSVDNTPLVDYTIKDGGREFDISAKVQARGVTANVVKPQDVLKLLEDGGADKKWKGQREYQLLQDLAGSTTTLSAIIAGCRLADDFPTEFKGLGDKLLEYLEGKKNNDVELMVFSEFAHNNRHLKRRKYWTLREIAYECEKSIMRLTKEKQINIHPLFQEAINNRVYYVKFTINTQGAPVWDPLDAVVLDANKVYIRSKNDHSRSQDRMGISM